MAKKYTEQNFDPKPEFDPKYEWIKPSQTKENKEFAAFVKNSPVMEEYFKDGESDIPFELFDEEAQQTLRALIENYEKGTQGHGNNVAGALCRDDLCFEMKTVLRHRDTIMIGDEYAGKIA